MWPCQLWYNIDMFYWYKNIKVYNLIPDDIMMNCTQQFITLVWLLVWKSYVINEYYLQLCVNLMNSILKP